MSVEVGGGVAAQAAIKAIHARATRQLVHHSGTEGTKENTMKTL
jgi:hypothetical protein